MKLTSDESKNAFENDVKALESNITDILIEA